MSLWGLLIPIRRHFRQYVNLRPVRVLAGMVSPLRDRGPEDIDFYVVRENNEGEYSEIGGRLYEGTEHEMVMQESVFTRQGVDRVLAYAFELARSREAKHLTSATKSNGIIHTMPYWDERFEAMAKRYAEVRTSRYHVDILAANFVLHPDWFDVVVGSNLFGDILSDLGPAIAGTIGIAPSANINPEREFPSMFEPVHGSAPDIAGAGHRQPHRAGLVGRDDARAPGPPPGRRPTSSPPSRRCWTGGGPRTPDLGGQATTVDPRPGRGGRARRLTGPESPSAAARIGRPRSAARDEVWRSGPGHPSGPHRMASPRERYAAAVAGGRLRPDAGQARAVDAFEALHQALDEPRRRSPLKYFRRRAEGGARALPVGRRGTRQDPAHGRLLRGRWRACPSAVPTSTAS